MEFKDCFIIVGGRLFEVSEGNSHFMLRVKSPTVNSP